MLLYSYPAELLEIIVCFYDFQEINDSLFLIKKHVNDLFVFGHATQFASQYVVNLFFIFATHQDFYSRFVFLCTLQFLRLLPYMISLVFA